MMVISAAQALAEGTTPAIINGVAGWHENRFKVIGRVLKEGKNRAFGDRVSDRDMVRHQETAAELRAVAADMRGILHSRAV